MTTGESFAMKHTTYDENSPTPKSIIFPTTKITTPWTFLMLKIWDYPKLQKLTAKTAETQWVLQQPPGITEEVGESKVQDEA